MRLPTAKLIPVVLAALASLASVVVVQLAMADGIERRTRPPPAREASAPVAPDVPALMGAELPAPCLDAAQASEIIRTAAEGASAETMREALGLISGEPGPGSPEAQVLSQQLRADLGIRDGVSGCEPVQTALNEATQFAQIASDEPTGAIGPPTDVGRPDSLSPSRFSSVPPGYQGGANGTGYCHLNAPRCGRG